MRRPPACLLAALLCAGSASLASAQALPSRYGVAWIMRGPEIVGTPPSQVRWTDDSRWVYFRWKPAGEPWHAPASLYRVRADGGEPERLTDEQADSLGVLIARGDISADERRRVVAHQGDLFLIDRRTLAVRRLTDTAARESAPAFARDGRRVFFIRDDDVYELTLDGGAIRQLTRIGTEAEEEDKEAEGQRRFLEEQQKELFESVRIEAERREREEARREAAEAREPERVVLDKGESVASIDVSPTGTFGILRTVEEARDARRTLVPDYVTSSGYTETLEVRDKVADAQEEGRVGVLDLTTGAVRWLEIAPPLPEDSAARAMQGAGRLAFAEFLGWNEQGTLGLLAAMAYDFKDLWLLVVDASTGEVKRIAHDHSDAWIQGPCDDWSAGGGCVGWLPDGRGVWFVSERDGWSHLYTVPATGGAARQLTSGEWEVYSAQLSPDEERFFIESSEGSRFERHFWHMSLAGGARTRITTETGQHDVVVSPDGRRIADVFGAADTPPELYVRENRARATPRRLTTSPSAEWLARTWVRPEIVHVPARDGTPVPARIYRPRDLGAQSNGAGVIFVHGAGYLQNVHEGWSSYYREYMFHHLLASLGYTVLDLDYRGSAGHGAAWRTAVYRHMGGLDLTDQVDGAGYLAEHEGVDAGRIGLYGGSYGGFITLMALFTEAEHFAAGAALRSVTDWAHYNHWYTSRILNLPHEDTLAYRRSSPIWFAEGLEDPLLIAHGMVDVNVHFQDVVRLAQRLIELGKSDWELAVYPEEDHAFVAPASWTDEYGRILELFERHLRKPLTSNMEDE